jgi:hypothetical protein
MPRPCVPLLLLAALVGSTAAIAAGPSPRAVARADASLVAFADAGDIQVQDGIRRSTAAVPAASRVSALVRLDTGWLLAGTAPSADGGSELWLRRGGAERVVAVPPPAGRVATLRHGPVVLGAAGSVDGLAWLEGSDRRQLEVRFAAWTETGFGSPQQVAPRGRGSQLALAGARLADGRLLLVWAGYDGEDDEIWASLGDGDAWTQPVRVDEDNRVPDITPTVIAVGEGALIAWSRFDGSEYQLVLSRFDGRRFLPARPVAAPGSVYPTFERDGGRLGLLFVDARRGGWALRELDSNGRPGRLGRFALRGEAERPVVRLSERGVDWQLSEAREATAWE